MSWTNLFKSKSGKLKPDPRIRWFGKLPTYSDYYSSPADEEWAVEFNDWVLKGFERFQSRLSGEDKKIAKLPISGCAVRLPKSGMTVFASVLDFGGDMRGRPFPICFYAGVPSAHWPGPTSDRLTGASRVIRALMAMKREVPSFLNSPGHFDSVFGGREVDLSGINEDCSDTGWLAASRSVPLADWFDDAKCNLKVKDRERWLGLAAAWGDRLAALESKTFEPTLRFPLAMRVSADLQIAGWIRWLESRIDLKRRSSSLILSGESSDDRRHLTVIARQLDADDFLLLTPLSHTVPYLDNLSHVQDAQDGEDTSHAPEPSGEPTTYPTTWTGFVERGANVT